MFSSRSEFDELSDIKREVERKKNLESLVEECLAFTKSLAFNGHCKMFVVDKEVKVVLIRG